MKRAALLIVLLLAATDARAQTAAPATSPATPLPPARNGVITPGNGSSVDPRMPVMHPRVPGRTPVIRPSRRQPGSGTVIEPR